MNEFGSDFHFIGSGNLRKYTLQFFYPFVRYYADGRQAIVHLYHHQGWRRLWVPEYFCYEVIDSFMAAGLDLALYTDYPEADDRQSIGKIQFEEGDALLRVNFFGLRGLRTNKGIPVPVIEDHTHDLVGEWAIHSDADWCIASLRKSLPIAEGGALWSPKGHLMPPKPCYSEDNETIADRRWQAMKLKADFLYGRSVDKSGFRNEMLETEAYFDYASISSIDKFTRDYIDSFDVFDWYSRKRLNWVELSKISTERFRLLMPETPGCNAFSFTILCDSTAFRNHFRELLIENCIYPAILWSIPESASSVVRDFSSRMLSLHCDGRYSNEDIRGMKSLIESVLLS